MSEEVAAVLEQAADLIETKGHCKGVYFSPTGEHCLVGALAEVIKLYDMCNWHDAFQFEGALVALKTELWGNPLRADVDLMNWNDMKDRKSDQVVDLLKTTAKDLRNRSGDAGAA